MEGAEKVANCESATHPKSNINATKPIQPPSVGGKGVGREQESCREAKGSGELGMGVGGTELNHSSFMSGDEFKSCLTAQEKCSLIITELAHSLAVLSTVDQENQDWSSCGLGISGFSRAECIGPRAGLPHWGRGNTGQG